MNNFEIFQKIEEVKSSVKVENLFWIATCLDVNSRYSNLKKILEEIELTDYEKMFPNEYKEMEPYFKNNDHFEALFDFKKFGLLAELHIAETDDFSFKNNKPVSWSTHGGCCSIVYIYAETMEELFEKILKEEEIMFKESVEQFKSKILK